MENNALQVDYSNWEPGKQYPEWMDEISLATISKGYLLPGEDVRKAYRRVAKAAAFRLKKPELENKFFKSRDNLVYALETDNMPSKCTDEHTWNGRMCEMYCEVRHICPYNNGSENE